MSLEIKLDNDPLNNNLQTVGFTSTPAIPTFTTPFDIIPGADLIWQQVNHIVDVPAGAPLDIDNIYVFPNSSIAPYTAPAGESEGFYMLSTYVDNFSLTPIIDLSITLNSWDDESCPDASDGAINVTVGSDVQSLEWTGPNGFTSNVEDITNLESGIYTLEVRGIHGCTETLDVPVGLINPDCCTDDTAVPTIIPFGANEVWNTNEIFYNDVIVSNGASLTIMDCDLQFAADVQIVIEIGGYLLVQNATLDALETCDMQWGGIEIHGNSFLPSESIYQGTGAFIDIDINNARVGLSLGELDDNFEKVQNRGGGHGKFVDVDFKNNEKDLWIFDYTPFTENMKFSDITSILDNEYFSSADYPEVRVELDGVNNVEIQNSLFGNANFELLAHEQAYKFTAIRAIDAPFKMFSVSPTYYPEDAILSHIIGFTYGIRAIGGNQNFYNIRKVRMFCQRNIFMRSTFNTNIYSNQLFPYWYFGQTAELPEDDLASLEDLGYEDIPGTTNDPVLMGGYGIYLAGFTGADVQENRIYRSGFVGHSGIILNNTFDDNLPIYNNEIYKADTGIKCLNRNRVNGFPATGAEFRCNEFAGNILDVEVNAITPLCATCGVAQSQGTSNTSAGNEFDQVYDLAGAEQLVNFLDNDLAHNYNRIGDPSLTEPVNSETSNYTLLPVDLDNGCPSLLPPNAWPYYQPSMNVSKDEIYSQYATAQSQWSGLVDGGDTEALTDEVINTEFSEALTLYYELMAKSPNLSEKVMIEAIEKEYDLPMVLLKQILTSNPQAAKSKEIKDKLDNRLLPLPEYMKEEIMEGLTWVSQKEILESEMSELREEYRRIERLESATILGDELVIDKKTALLVMIDNSAFPETNLEKATRLWSWSELSEAIEYIDDVLSSMLFESQEYRQLADLKSLLELENDLQSGILTLEDAESDLAAAAENHDFYFQPYADMLIEKYSQSYVYEDVNYPQVHMSLRASFSSDDEVKVELLKLYPNPATNVLVVEKGSLPLTGAATYEVLDVTGRIVIQVMVAPDFQQVLDVSELAHGSYYLLLKDNGELLSKQTFIKH